jgi:hypothetical protein
VEEDINEILGVIRRKLSDDSKENLTKDITEEDVRKAMRNTANDKAPGMDGIPVELWKTLDDQYLEDKKEDDDTRKCNIVWMLTQAYLDIETKGMDQIAKLNEGCMSPIYKKKNPDDIANYRPITLLNTDYKIYTKALSVRLAGAIKDIIHPDQAGFIQGRSIFDQVKTTKMVIDYTSRTAKKGAVIALDQEKAYDKILHGYLWAVMKKFNFPDRFIRTIGALYNGALTTILINGELSDPFEVLRCRDRISDTIWNRDLLPTIDNRCARSR